MYFLTPARSSIAPLGSFEFSKNHYQAVQKKADEGEAERA
jgi:hypothetical protein